MSTGAGAAGAPPQNRGPAPGGKMPSMVGPTLEIARIQSEINRLFESLMELKQLGESAEPMWMPNTDILDGPESLQRVRAWKKQQKAKGKGKQD